MDNKDFYKAFESLQKLGSKDTREIINKKATDFIYKDMIRWKYIPKLTGTTKRFPITTGKAEYNKNILRWGSYNPHTDEYYILRPRYHWSAARRAEFKTQPEGVYFVNRTGQPYWDITYATNPVTQELSLFEVNKITLKKIGLW